MVAPQRGQEPVWPSRLEARSHLPDFIFAIKRNAQDRRIVALETKGEHLQNPDTDYKRDVLEVLSRNFSWEAAVSAGQLQLQNTGEVMECALILMDDIPTELPKHL